MYLVNFAHFGRQTSHALPSLCQLVGGSRFGQPRGKGTGTSRASPRHAAEKLRELGKIACSNILKRQDHPRTLVGNYGEFSTSPMDSGSSFPFQNGRLGF